MQRPNLDRKPQDRWYDIVMAVVLIMGIALIMTIIWFVIQVGGTLD